MVAEEARNLGLHSVRRRRSRAMAQNLCQRIGKRPWLGSLITLSWVTPYHSFIEKWRLRTPSRYAALPLQAVTYFRA
jgi:hypothetical protein